MNLQEICLKNVHQKFKDMGPGSKARFAEWICRDSSHVARMIAGQQRVNLEHLQMFSEFFKCEPKKLLDPRGCGFRNGT